MMNRDSIVSVRLQALSLLLGTALLLLFQDSIEAQQFKNSIASTDFDFITNEDPSTYSKLTFVEKGRAEMPGKHKNELWGQAFVFDAEFNDNTNVKIFIDAENKDQGSAEKDARRFVHPLGKLPTNLRKGVHRLVVHSGGEKYTAFADVGLIVMYSDNASVRIKNHDLEETIFHESVHAAWDKKHANSEGWVRAQASDNAFATMYAKSKPKREDLAESALFAYTLIHHPKRLPASVEKMLRKTIPARIRFVEILLPHDKPLHYRVGGNIARSGAAKKAKANNIKPDSKGPQSLCDIQFSGIAADIISNALLLEFNANESQVQRILDDADDRYDSGEEVFRVVVNKFGLNPKALKLAVRKHLHTNCNHGVEFEDTGRVSMIDSWEAK